MSRFRRRTPSSVKTASGTRGCTAAVVVVGLDVDAAAPARRVGGVADARPGLAHLVGAARRGARRIEAALRVLGARDERRAVRADVGRARTVRIGVAGARPRARAALVRPGARRARVPGRASVALDLAGLHPEPAAPQRPAGAGVGAALRAPRGAEACAARARRCRRRVEAPLGVLAAPVEGRSARASRPRRLARGIHGARARGRPRAAAPGAGLMRAARHRRAPRPPRRARLDSARALRGARTADALARAHRAGLVSTRRHGGAPVARPIACLNAVTRALLRVRRACPGANPHRTRLPGTGHWGEPRPRYARLNAPRGALRAAIRAHPAGPRVVAERRRGRARDGRAPRARRAAGLDAVAHAADRLRTAHAQARASDARAVHAGGAHVLVLPARADLRLLTAAPQARLHASAVAGTGGVFGACAPVLDRRVHPVHRHRHPGRTRVARRGDPGVGEVSGVIRPRCRQARRSTDARARLAAVSRDGAGHLPEARGRQVDHHLTHVVCGHLGLDYPLDDGRLGVPCNRRRRDAHRLIRTRARLERERRRQLQGARDEEGVVEEWGSAPGSAGPLLLELDLHRSERFRRRHVRLEEHLEAGRLLRRTRARDHEDDSSERREPGEGARPPCRTGPRRSMHGPHGLHTVS